MHSCRDDGACSNAGIAGVAVQGTYDPKLSGLPLLYAVRVVQVLAAAASNVAVDNLTERLGAALPLGSVVRVGHVARVLPQVTHPWSYPCVCLSHNLWQCTQGQSGVTVMIEANSGVSLMMLCPSPHLLLLCTATPIQKLQSSTGNCSCSESWRAPHSGVCTCQGDVADTSTS